jgi:trans-aconitate 2-methyltransferase
MTSEWDAVTYHRVSDPQFEWGRAVLARLAIRGDERVIDAGCGSGRLTRELARRLPNGVLIGLDASADMLTQARAHLLDCRPEVYLVRAALPRLPFSTWADVVFSTATFHWVLDHPALFTHVWTALKPGGRLLAQCGGAGNLARAREPASQVMRLPAFAPFFAGWRGAWEFPDAGVTAARLLAAGFTDVDTALEDAPVVFTNEDDFRAFVTTVVFRQHLARLPEALRGGFMAELIARVRTAPEQFTLDYKRLNISARRRN